MEDLKKQMAAVAKQSSTEKKVQKRLEKQLQWRHTKGAVAGRCARCSAEQLDLANPLSECAKCHKGLAPAALFMRFPTVWHMLCMDPPVSRVRKGWTCRECN